MAKHGKQRREGLERQGLLLAKTILVASLVGNLVCACNHRERKSGPRSVASAVASTTSAASAPSAVTTVPPGTRRSAVATGYTSGLRLDSDTLVYCDDRGSRSLDLISGEETARTDPCSEKTAERNGTCAGIEYVDDVRTPWQQGQPGPGPDDVIDTKDGVIPANGRVHDCAFNNGILLYATGVEIVAVDIKTDRHDKKGNDGGNQVAINDAGLAWSDYQKVFAERR